MNRRSFLGALGTAASIGVPSASTESESVGSDDVEGELIREVGDRLVYHYQSDHYDYILHQWTITDARNEVLDRISARSPILGCWYVSEHQLFVSESPLNCACLSRSYRFHSDISRLRVVYDDGRTEVSDWDAVKEKYVREFDSAG